MEPPAREVEGKGEQGPDEVHGDKPEHKRPSGAAGGELQWSLRGTADPSLQGTQALDCVLEIGRTNMAMYISSLLRRLLLIAAVVSLVTGPALRVFAAPLSGITEAPTADGGCTTRCSYNIVYYGGTLCVAWETICVDPPVQNIPTPPPALAPAELPVVSASGVTSTGGNYGGACGNGGGWFTVGTSTPSGWQANSNNTFSKGGSTINGGTSCPELQSGPAPQPVPVPTALATQTPTAADLSTYAGTGSDPTQAFIEQLASFPSEGTWQSFGYVRPIGPAPAVILPRSALPEIDYQSVLDALKLYGVSFASGGYIVAGVVVLGTSVYIGLIDPAGGNLAQAYMDCLAGYAFRNIGRPADVVDAEAAAYCQDLDPSAWGYMQSQTPSYGQSADHGQKWPSLSEVPCDQMFNLLYQWKYSNILNTRAVEVVSTLTAQTTGGHPYFYIIERAAGVEWIDMVWELEMRCSDKYTVEWPDIASGEHFNWEARITKK